MAQESSHKVTHAYFLGGKDGCVTDRIINYYRELARGGAGLIIVGYAYIDDKASKSSPCQLGVSSCEHQPGLGWLAETIKENGAKACLPNSPRGEADPFLGAPPLKAPSRVPWEDIYAMGVPVPEELSIEEIEEIVEAFGDAALRAKSWLGLIWLRFTGHGYLDLKLSLTTCNKRGDWYGGSLKNRMRFLLEVSKTYARK